MRKFFPAEMSTDLKKSRGRSMITSFHQKMLSDTSIQLTIIDWHSSNSQDSFIISQHFPKRDHLHFLWSETYSIIWIKILINIFLLQNGSRLSKRSKVLSDQIQRPSTNGKIRRSLMRWSIWWHEIVKLFSMPAVNLSKKSHTLKPKNSKESSRNFSELTNSNIVEIFCTSWQISQTGKDGCSQSISWQRSRTDTKPSRSTRRHCENWMTGDEIYM